MAWFRELVPRVKRFADLFVLDVVMSVDERAQGLIQLEGVAFDLSLVGIPGPAQPLGAAVPLRVAEHQPFFGGLSNPVFL